MRIIFNGALTVVTRHRNVSLQILVAHWWNCNNAVTV